MRIAVIGLGYVGCVAVAKLCEAGHDVVGVDLNEKKVSLVNEGKPTIIEPGLDELFQKAVHGGRLRAVTSLRDVAADADVFYVCVGTPLKPDGDLDLSAIYHVGEELASLLQAGGPARVLVIRSTVKPGTCAALSTMLRERHVSVVMNPEFLREGTALEDWDVPGIIVIGAFDDHGKAVAARLHEKIAGQVFHVRPESAELIKYINNSWHALKVAFGNEVGRLSHAYRIDHEELMDMFLADKKLNLSGYYLRPGMPYGGSCLPKDLSALTIFARDHHLPAPVLEAVAQSNAQHMAYIVDLIVRCGKANIGVWGLAFKKETDDLRHSPSVEIVRLLVKKGLVPFIYDQNVDLKALSGQNRDQIADLVPVLERALMPTLEEMLAKADIVLVAHDRRGTLAALKERYPAKVFLEMFRFKMPGV